jgi:spore photoproduct lyase family protein
MSFFDIKQLYIQRSAVNIDRAKEVISKFPDAKKIYVDSHWNLDINKDANNAEDWLKIKKHTLIVGIKSSLSARENGRSTDYIAPSHSSGCVLGCSYCTVARRKGYANPVTVFTNIKEIKSFIVNHASKLPAKQPNQCDPTYWTYDIGENNDCSVDVYFSDNVKDLVHLFRTIPNAKASFASKHVINTLLRYDPQLKTRLRFSIMPPSISKVVDVRTTPVEERIKSINNFVDAGYEVHINISPVIVYEGWTADYANLFQMLNDNLSQKSKNQLKSEVIFLTHNEELHQINTKWHPKGEELLWKPQWQEPKISQTGGHNLRYKYNLKYKMIDMFRDVYNKHISYAPIRYIF